MIKTIEKIAKEVCERLGMYSENAVKLIIATGKAESGFRALEQTKGPAVGFFQIEPDTINDVMDNYAHYRPHIMQELIDLGLKQDNQEFSVLSNIALLS